MSQSPTPPRPKTASPVGAPPARRPQTSTDPYQDGQPTGPLLAPPRWLTLADLTAAAGRLASQLPPDTTVVAGVPRSGMGPAALVACLIHARLAQLTEAGGLEYLEAGYRWTSRPRDRDESGRVAVVDDSIASGSALAKLRPALDQLKRRRPVTVAACFVDPGRADRVDLYAALLPQPHLLAWNFWNSHQADALAVDFDGILCPDFAGPADEQGPAYLEHLAAAPPVAWPRRSPLDLIATARLETYRQPTESWLARHGITYRRLAMCPHHSPQSRSRFFDPAQFKAEQYAASGARYFVESDVHQAQRIFELTGRPVICPPAARVWAVCTRRADL